MLLKCVALSLIIMSISQYRTKHNNYSLNKLNNIDWNNFRLNKKSLGNVPDFYIFTGGTQSNGKIRTMKSLSLYCVKLQHRQRTEACPYMTRHGFNHLFWIKLLSVIYLSHALTGKGIYWKINPIVLWFHIWIKFNWNWKIDFETQPLCKLS